MTCICPEEEVQPHHGGPGGEAPGGSLGGRRKAKLGGAVGTFIFQMAGKEEVRWDKQVLGWQSSQCQQFLGHRD